MGSGEPSPHTLMGRRQQCTCEGRRDPKFLNRYLPQIRFSSSYLNFSFRQIPFASVGFRGLPWAIGNHLHIYCFGADNNVLGMVAGSQSSWAKNNLKFEFPALFILILASVSFRQLPWAPVDFRGQWETISTYILLGRRKQSMWEGGRSQSF